MLNARAIALQGIGFAAVFVAAQGLQPVPQTTGGGVWPSPLVALAREQAAVHEARLKRLARETVRLRELAAELDLTRALAAASEQRASEAAAIARAAASVERVRLAVEQGQQATRRDTALVTALLATPRAEVTDNLVTIQRNDNRRRAIILTAILLA
jgi:hypothetical protein